MLLFGASASGQDHDGRVRRVDVDSECSFIEEKMIQFPTSERHMIEDPCSAIFDDKGELSR